MVVPHGKPLMVIAFVSVMASCSFSPSNGSTGKDSGGKGAIRCVVAFDSQGGSAIAPQTVEKGALVKEPSSPAKEGFSFAGWYIEAACATAWSFANDRVQTDTTLYAKWVSVAPPPENPPPVIPTPVKFKVTFDSQGGSPVASQTVDKGSFATEPTAPVKAGFDFAGWYAEASCATAWAFATTAITEDRTLYAKWNATTGSGGITVMPFDPESVSISAPSDVTFGNSFSAIATCSVDVDSFAWYLDDTLVAGQVTATFVGGAELTRGPHTVLVVVVKDGVPYSASRLVTVR